MTISSRIMILQELVAALDRRLPRIDHPAETAIARDAVTLKTRALEQIAVLERTPTPAAPDEA
jgi:hypothetical protein